MKAKELCQKAYGDKHLLACRLYLNIGILYEDNRDFQEAYDYFVKWHDCSMNVSLILVVLCVPNGFSCRSGGRGGGGGGGGLVLPVTQIEIARWVNGSRE